MGVARPVDRHRLRAGHITIENRRLHAAAAITLHPAEQGKGETGQLFAEIFHHVVAFGFAMYQHIQTELFLLFYGQADFSLHRCPIAGGIERAAPEAGPRRADFRRLREGADRGGRQGRQLETIALQCLALGESAAALSIARLQSGQTLRHRRVMDARRIAASLHGTLAGKQCTLDSLPPLRQPALQGADLGQFLPGKRQPAQQIPIQITLLRQINRHMLQRTTAADPQAIAKPGPGLLQHGQRGIQIGGPDIAAIDHAQREYLALRPIRQEGRQLLRRTLQIEMYAGHRQIAQQRSMLTHRFEIGRQQDGRLRLGQLAVDRREGCQPFGR